VAPVGIAFEDVAAHVVVIARVVVAGADADLVACPFPGELGFYDEALVLLVVDGG